MLRKFKYICLSLCMSGVSFGGDLSILSSRAKIRLTKDFQIPAHVTKALIGASICNSAKTTNKTICTCYFKVESSDSPWIMGKGIELNISEIETYQSSQSVVSDFIYVDKKYIKHIECYKSNRSLGGEETETLSVSELSSVLDGRGSLEF